MYETKCCTFVNVLCMTVVTLMAQQWIRPSEEMEPGVFSIAEDSSEFKGYYDDIQEYLKVMAGYDELWAGTGSYIHFMIAMIIFLGMLSKSRSHALRVATVFHVLFMIEEAYVN